MARPKKRNPLLEAARAYIDQRIPELRGARLKLHLLDGPPGAARYAVSAEACFARVCPRGFPTGRRGGCSTLDCPLRRSARLLLNRRGEVLQVTRSGIHWT